MFWPAFVFNLCVGLLLAAYLLRGVLRFERRADAVMAKLDQWRAAELRKFDVARDEIKAALRVQVNHALAKLKFEQRTKVRPLCVPSADEIRKLPRWARVA